MRWHEADAAVDAWVLHNRGKSIGDDPEGIKLVESAIAAFHRCMDTGAMTINPDSAKRLGQLYEQVGYNETPLLRIKV